MIPITNSTKSYDLICGEQIVPIQLGEDAEKVTATECKALIENDKPIPSNITVEGDLVISNCEFLVSLPQNIIIQGNLLIEKCPRFVTIGQDVTVTGNVTITRCNLFTRIHQNFEARGSFTLSFCSQLTAFPEVFTVGKNVSVKNCQNFTSLTGTISGDIIINKCNMFTFFLPKNRHIQSLTIKSCRLFATLRNELIVENALTFFKCPKLTVMHVKIEAKNIHIEHCSAIAFIPDCLTVLDKLTIKCCSKLVSIHPYAKIEMLEVQNCELYCPAPSYKDLSFWAKSDSCARSTEKYSYDCNIKYEKAENPVVYLHNDMTEEATASQIFDYDFFLRGSKYLAPIL